MRSDTLNRKITLFCNPMKQTSGRTFEKAVFLDRDGVINFDEGNYTTSVADFEVIDGNLQQMKTWFDNGYGLIVITNQGGVDKGLFTHDQVKGMHQYLQGLCNLHGFFIDAFYYCLHHPEVTGNCLCRKPGSLMVEKALHRFSLDAENCVMIGDRDRDIEAAAKAGVRGILIGMNTGLNGINPFG